MRIIATECSEEQTKQDAPELMKMHAQALKTDMMWEFFGGTITLPNGNQRGFNGLVSGLKRVENPGMPVWTFG